MKSKSLQLFGVALCVAVAAAVSWSNLPTSAEGDSCPLKAAAAAKAAKAEGACCEGEAKNASLAANAGECCKDKAAATTADAKGECPKAAAAASLAANKEGECSGGECPKAAAAKNVAAAEGECSGKNLTKLVMNDTRFSTFVLAVKASGEAGRFECPSQKTVFAPTNDAFEKIPAEQWAAILQDDAKLKALVANHFVADNALKSCAMKEAKTAKTTGGADLAISACPQSGNLSVNNANVVGADLVATNGIIHAIDSVLMPANMEVAKAEEAVAAEPVQVAATN